jgi:hypothetical protein
MATIKVDADKEKLLVRYLLGELPEEQRIQVEEMFLGDDRHYEELLALEDELYYDYAQGNLSARERAQFKERFLSSGRNNKQAILASAMAQIMTQAKAAPARNPEPVQSRWQSLQAYFSLPSLAALAVMLLVSIFLLVGTVRLRKEFNSFREERLAQEEQLRQQTQQERARADELSSKLKRELNENAKPRAESVPERKKPLPLISLVLSSSAVRDLTSEVSKVQIPPGNRLLRFQLNLRGEVTYNSYQVVLSAEDGGEKWTLGRLRPRRTGFGQILIFNLPSKILAEGDYELRVKGHASGGILEETGDYYYFSAVRK